MIEFRPIYVICLREFKKFFREKSRLLGTLARPVLWLFVVGNGMNSLIRPQVGFSYLQFIFPGMIGMTILFSSIFSSISIVWDREFGFMKEMLVAPISRLSIVIGKAISGTLISVAQAVIILVLIPFLGIHLTVMQFFEVVAVSLLVSFCITSLGILIAARLTSFDGFNIIMNFLVMPMLFLSGAMYPVTSMPPALRHLTQINPLTYGIDAFKHVLLRNATPPLGPEFPLGARPRRRHGRIRRSCSPSPHCPSEEKNKSYRRDECRQYFVQGFAAGISLTLRGQAPGRSALPFPPHRQNRSQPAHVTRL